MENKSSDRQGKISLDKIVREIAELESSRGEPDKIWSLSDIDELIASTNAVSPVPADEDDAELLTSIQYYEDAYSDDKALGYEPVREPEPEPEYEPEETAEPEQGADEPNVDISDKTEDEAPAEPEEANEAPAEAEPEDEVPAEEAVSEEAVEAPAEEEDEAPVEDVEAFQHRLNAIAHYLFGIERINVHQVKILIDGIEDIHILSHLEIVIFICLCNRWPHEERHQQ